MNCLYLITLLAVLIGLSTAQWGYGGYGGYGRRPWGGYGRFGPRPFGRGPTVIEKTVVIRPGGWKA